MNRVIRQLVEKRLHNPKFLIPTDEALKKKLPTQNPMYGIYGELRRNVPGQQDALWQAISNGLHDANPSYGLAVIRNFLDSKYGKTLFDDIKHLIVDQDEISLNTIREEVRSLTDSARYKQLLDKIVKATDKGLFDDEDE